MFFKKIAFLLLFLTVSVLAKAQQADSVLTLQQCVDIAIKNNVTVKKSETQVERNRIDWMQARENLLPTLNGNASQSETYGHSSNPNTGVIIASQSNSGQYSLNSNLLLSNGLSYVNAVKQTGLLFQAGKMDFQQVKDLTTLNIISLFLQALNAEDQLSQANFQFAASKVNLDRETNLNDAGAVPPADFYNIKGAHANDALNVINAQNAVTSARLNLLEAMGVPFNKEIRLVRLTIDKTPVKYDQDASQVYATALNDLALVKAADLRVKAAEKEVLVYKGRLYPTLSLGAGVTTTYSNYAAPGSTAPSFSTQFRSNYQYGPSLNLQIPILNYFQNRNNLHRAKLDLTDAQNTNTDTQVQLKQQVQQAYANMTAAFDRFQAATEQVAAYQSAFNAQEVKFNAGVITADIFVIAKNNLDFANTNLINAHYDYLIRIKILDYYQGKLTF